MQVWGCGVLIGMVVVIAALLSEADPTTRLWVVLAELLFMFMVPATVGPWIGHWVRRQGWDLRPEAITLVGALAALVALSMVCSRYVAAPLTDAVLMTFGAQPASTQPVMARLSIGIQVEPTGKASARAALPSAQPSAHGASGVGSGGAAKGAPMTCAEGEVLDAAGLCSHDNATDPRQGPLQIATTALALFGLAGGGAIRRCAREREGLAALEREKALAVAQAQRRTAEMRLSVLAAQVEPHFLFNTLAAVRSAISTDPERASTMVDRLVDYLRASIPRLRSDGASDNTLGAQLELVRAYLGLMSARMPRLSVEIGADDALLGRPFPPLMLLSLAENAIKHGVEPKIGPVRIEVTAAVLSDGRLAVTVADDGVGFSVADTTGSGIGLVNIRERLREMYGDQAALDLKARQGGGVAATLTLPTETA